MKLIDLLVQELPKRGGWPSECEKIEMSGTGKLFGNSYEYLFDGEIFPKPYDCKEGLVTREQYEAALAESAWNGEGLPPVGCECEAKYLHSTNAEWFAFRCIAVDCEVAFGWDGKQPANLILKDFEFRPIQTEAERERNARITTLNNFISGFMKSTGGDYTHLGEAIYEWQNVLDKLKK